MAMIPAIIGSFRPVRSASSPAGIDSSPAVSMKAPLIVPTSAGPAPSVAANSGMTGIRRYELKKAAKPIRQSSRKGVIWKSDLVDVLRSGISD